MSLLLIELADLAIAPLAVLTFVIAMFVGMAVHFFLSAPAKPQGDK
jgi:hypothetical protein